MEVLTRALLKAIPKVRLVGNNINEVITTQEAIAKAEDEGMDLVLVNPDSAPPVVRIQDFKKVQYEKKKSKKVQKKTSLKELQFSTNISEHDLETKLKAIEKFLSRGDKVKIIVRLKGRERENPERAEALIERIISASKCKASKIPGPIAMALLEPVRV